MGARGVRNRRLQDSGAATQRPRVRERRLVNTTRRDSEGHAAKSKFQPQCNYHPGKEGIPLLGWQEEQENKLVRGQFKSLVEVSEGE